MITVAPPFPGRCQKSRKGAALVEFAVVLPVLLLFLGGMLEVSRLLMLQHTADTAAYEAARSAMVPGAEAADAVSEALVLLDAAGLHGSILKVTPTNITQDTAFITVRIEIPVDENCWIAPDRFTDYSVMSEVTLLTERSPIVRLTGLPALKAKKSKVKGNKTGL